MKKLLLSMVVFLFGIGLAQSQNINSYSVTKGAHPEITERTCATGTLPVEFEAWLSEKIQEMKSDPNRESSIVYNIPVVVHIIHNGTAVGTGDNLSNSQIQTQIDVLNKDFRKLNTDWSNTPSAFQAATADCEINFCMAQVDPMGNTMSEAGVNRIDRNSKGWTAPPYSSSYVDGTIKPNSIWNPNNYMNMWVMNLSGGLLGYATFPAGSTLPGLSSPFGTLTSDGVVIYNRAFGTIGTLLSAYNKGRTATHEIGHWLGLRHIWGDANCGNDYCTDTPTQQSSNFSCPTFPKVTCGNGPNGEMFMNFMDYVPDACMVMFTNDQKTRVQTVMANSPFRVNLAQSTACNASSGAPVANFSANVTNITVGGSVNFTDLSTNSPTSWSWSFPGGTPSSSPAQNPVGIIYNTAGVYNVSLTASNASGSNLHTKNGYIIVTSTGGGGCDSMSNYLSTHTPTSLLSNNGGYVAGTNGYQDIGKADKFSNSVPTNQLIGAIMYFAAASGGANTFEIKAWNNSGTGGSPGTAIGAPATMSHATAAAAVAGGMPSIISFPAPITVTSDFYLGIQFGNASGDTIALFTNADGETSPATAWELWGPTPSGWYAYDDANSWGLGMAHRMYAIMCPPVGIPEVYSNSSISLYPNPATTTISAVLGNQFDRSEVSARIMDVSGKVVFDSKMNSNIKGFYQIDVRELSNGIYFLEFYGNDFRVSDKFTIKR